MSLSDVSSGPRDRQGGERLPGLLSCRVCGGSGNFETFSVREMMYGSRVPFEYFQCAHCGCLQITQIPDDLGRFYPANYYSLAHDPADDYRQPLKNFVWRWRDRVSLFVPGSHHLPWQAKKPHLRDGLNFLRRVSKLNLDTRMVDIGCGTGELLHRLHNAGFRQLTGIDPFLAANRERPGLRLIACDVTQLQGEYDVLILNHSFEHIPDQLTAMQAVRRLLAADGTAIVRVPLCDSLAWQTYGVDWFQLDAPRHLYLHTVNSLTRLAATAGLVVRAVVHDSDHHQFYISERYRQDIPMSLDPLRANGEPAKLRLGSRRRRQLAAQARVLNREHRGDQASFYLTPMVGRNG